MTDKEERQHVIEVLQNMVDWMEAINYIVATPERRHALGYAIASIETDLKYDLLYEETSGQADKQEIPVKLHITEIKKHQSDFSDLEPTTKNDLVVDAVSREAVNKLVSSQRLDTFSDEGRKWANIKIDAILKGLKELSSVTPIRPKGYWISHGEHCKNLGVIPSGLGAYEWCSNCDCGIDVREWHRNHYNYCPNCGAKMVEPQESEE